MNFTTHSSSTLEREDYKSYAAYRLGRRTLQFIYIDAGGGHRSTAMALREAIKDFFPQWEIEMVNLFHDVLKPIDPVHKLMRNHHAEDIYNGMLSRGWTYGFTAMLRGTQKLIKLYTPAMESLLLKHWQKNPRPDLVVSLVPHFNGVMFRTLRRIRPRVPYATLMTDMADYPPNFWQERQDQFIICSSDMAAHQAAEMGYHPWNIFKTSGMVLKPHFYKHLAGHDPSGERRKLGLDPDKPTALIMFGGNCAWTAEKIVKKLERSKLGVQSIVMCGKNEKLFKKLSGRRDCYPVSFTSTQVPYYMGLADFFIGKPGPGSISEALHMGLPVITESNAKTMPQERYNVTWLEEKELGIVIKDFSKVVDAVRTMLKGDNLDRFRQNASRINNRAIYEVPVILEHIMSNGA